MDALIALAETVQLAAAIWTGLALLLIGSSL